ncbi:MAG: hypothetical protein LW860_18040 [Xanthomonadaceae bacterium]|jgi:hypothetical protein|nr:hypothetical protein [Xanthomonadaceae bacterium]
MHRSHRPAPSHPALQRARLLTGRRGPRPLTIPLALNLGRATLLAAVLLGLSIAL